MTENGQGSLPIWQIEDAAEKIGSLNLNNESKLLK